MYRPKNWKNPHEIPPPRVYNNCLSELEFTKIYEAECIPVEKHEAYEAGADAMLEALKKEGVTLSIADQKIEIPGFVIVFIPD